MGGEIFLQKVGENTLVSRRRNASTLTISRFLSVVLSKRRGGARRDVSARFPSSYQTFQGSTIAATRKIYIFATHSRALRLYSPFYFPHFNVLSLSRRRVVFLSRPELRAISPTLYFPHFTHCRYYTTAKARRSVGAASFLSEKTENR